MNLVCSTLYGLCPHPQHCTTLIVSSTLYILYIFDTVWILNPVLAWYPKHCMNMMIASPTLYELDCILNIVQNLHPQYCLDPQHCMDPISQTLYEQDCILNTVWTWLCLKHCVEFAPNTVYTVYFRYSTDSGCILNTTRTLNPQHLIVHIHNTVRTLWTQCRTDLVSSTLYGHLIVYSMPYGHRLDISPNDSRTSMSRACSADTDRNNEPSVNHQAQHSMLAFHTAGDPVSGRYQSTLLVSACRLYRRINSAGSQWPIGSFD